MTATRNTGADLLPFMPRPSYPGARLRALQNARARREREAPPPDEAYTAERLRRDLVSAPPDVVLNGKQRDHLRRMGWTDALLRRALEHRVHPPVAVDPVVTAAGAAPRPRRGSSVAPAAVLNLTATHRRAILGNVAAARRARHDPDRFYREGGEVHGAGGCLRVRGRAPGDDPHPQVRELGERHAREDKRVDVGRGGRVGAGLGGADLRGGAVPELDLERLHPGRVGDPLVDGHRDAVDDVARGDPGEGAEAGQLQRGAHLVRRGGLAPVGRGAVVAPTALAVVAHDPCPPARTEAAPALFGPEVGIAAFEEYGCSVSVSDSRAAPSGTAPALRRFQQPHPLGQDLPGDDGRRTEHAGQQRLPHLAGGDVDANAYHASGSEGGGAALKNGGDSDKSIRVRTAVGGQLASYRWGYGGGPRAERWNWGEVSIPEPSGSAGSSASASRSGSAPPRPAPSPRRSQELDPLGGHLLHGLGRSTDDARQRQGVPEPAGFEVDASTNDGAGGERCDAVAEDAQDGLHGGRGGAGIRALRRCGHTRLQSSGRSRRPVPARCTNSTLRGFP